MSFPTKPGESEVIMSFPTKPNVPTKPNAATDASAVRGYCLDEAVGLLLEEPELDWLFEQDAELPIELASAARTLAESAFSNHDPHSLKVAHIALRSLYQQYTLIPGRDKNLTNQFSPPLLEVRLILERAWERHERGRIDTRDWEGLSIDKFTAAYQDLVYNHRVARHPLSDFLANSANAASITRYITSDGALNLRYFDIIVMALFGDDDHRVKREIVENLGDEVGADGAQMHTVLIHNSLASVGASQNPDLLTADLDWQGLAGINLYYLLGINRRLHDEFIGAMGVSEELDPPHNEKVVRGCRRVGLDGADTVAFYTTHIELERRHGNDWLENVTIPTVERHPDAARAVLTGAQMRLNTCADYYDAVLRKLLSDK